MTNNDYGTAQFQGYHGSKLYESVVSMVDPATGEVLKHEEISFARASTEPKFVKLYYQTMLAFNDIACIPVGFLLALSEVIDYANEDEPMVYENTKRKRRRLADLLQVSDNMVTKYIKKAVDVGILFKTEDRGCYEVNPWMLAKGRWESIKKLQADFDFVSGKWVRIVEASDDNTITEEAS